MIPYTSLLYRKKRQEAIDKKQKLMENKNALVLPKKKRSKFWRWLFH
jgi:hypothetical protein